jgi:uncharacterized protein (TIGR03435 family)
MRASNPATSAFLFIGLFVQLTVRASLGAQASDTSGAAPAFEVASIKPTESRTGPASGGLFAQGGRYNAFRATLRTLIRSAYQLQDFQIVGEPAWGRSERFDIAAKTEGNPSKDEMFRMVRTLLEDRFRLRHHREERVLPIYALVRADDRPRRAMRPSSSNCGGTSSTPGRPTAPDPAGCGLGGGFGVLDGRGATMEMLANFLSTSIGRLVIDRTGLTGTYDITLRWTPDQASESLPGPAPILAVDQSGPSIFTALREQLGLRLDAQQGPVDVLVVDHAERPTPD